MKLSNLDFDRINYWNYVTCSIDGIVTDILHINYGNFNLDLQFKFPRYKNLCYFESFRDYVECYSKQFAYINLFNQLNERAAYFTYKYPESLQV